MRLACVFAVPDTEIPYLCETVFPTLWEQGVQTIGQMNRPVIGYTRKGEETARTWQQNFVREFKRTPIMGVRSKTQAVAPPHVVISNNSNNLKETLNSFITHAADRIGA